jgi:uncharacterized membrane protein
MSFMHDPNSVSTGRGLNLEDSPKTTSMLALDSNLAAVISYFPVVPFNIVAAAIWLKTEPHNNRFVRFCAMQSLAVAAAWFVVGVGTWVVGIIPFIGPLISTAGYWFATLAYFGITLYLAFNAYKGQAVSLPVIGPLVESNIDALF